jgi:hypothetical protein
MRLEIGGGAARQPRIVLEIADAEIAVAAEQAAHDVGGMMVIDGQRLVGLLVSQMKQTPFCFASSAA